MSDKALLADHAEHQLNMVAAQKSLGDVVEACWAGHPMEIDELRHAVCALSALLVRDQQAMQTLATAELECRAPMRENSAVYQNEAYANRMSEALSSTPMDFLGELDDLGSPLMRVRRQARAMLAKFTNRATF